MSEEAIPLPFPTAINAARRINAFELTEPRYIWGKGSTHTTDWKNVMWYISNDVACQQGFQVMECSGHENWMLYEMQRNAENDLIASRADELLDPMLRAVPYVYKLLLGRWLGPGVTGLPVPPTYNGALQYRSELFKQLLRHPQRESLQSTLFYSDQEVKGMGPLQPVVRLSSTHCGALCVDWMGVDEEHGHRVTLIPCQRCENPGAMLCVVLGAELLEEEGTPASVKETIKELRVMISDVHSAVSSSIIPPSEVDDIVPLLFVEGSGGGDPPHINEEGEEEESAASAPGSFIDWHTAADVVLLLLVRSIGVSEFSMKQIEQRKSLGASLDSTLTASLLPMKKQDWFNSGEWELGSDLELLREQPLNVLLPCTNDAAAPLADGPETPALRLSVGIKERSRLCGKHPALLQLLKEMNGKVMSEEQEASFNAWFEKRMRLRKGMSARDLELLEEARHPAAFELCMMANPATPQGPADDPASPEWRQNRLLPAYVRIQAELPCHPGIERILTWFDGETSAYKKLERCLNGVYVNPAQAPNTVFLAYPRYTLSLADLQANRKAKSKSTACCWESKELAIILYQLARAVCILDDYGLACTRMNTDRVVFDVYGRAVIADFEQALPYRSEPEVVSQAIEMMLRVEPDCFFMPAELLKALEELKPPEQTASIQSNESLQGNRDAATAAAIKAMHKSNVYALAMMAFALVTNLPHEYWGNIESDFLQCMWSTTSWESLMNLMHETIDARVREVIAKSLVADPEQRLTAKQMCYLLGMYLWGPHSGQYYKDAEWVETERNTYLPQLIHLMMSRQQQKHFILPRVLKHGDTRTTDTPVSPLLELALHCEWLLSYNE